jgi:mono/diheme cytochrome c family protein
MRARFAVALVLVFAAASVARAADDFEAKVKAADAARGAQVFAQFCATCHGPQGLGDGPVGKTLNPPPRNFQEAKFKYGDTPRDHFNIISNGAASKGGSPLMAPWGKVISEQDRINLVKYVESLKKK